MEKYFEINNNNQDIRCKLYYDKQHPILDDIISMENEVGDYQAGSKQVSFDKSTKKWRLCVQLDNNRSWFLSVFFHENGDFNLFSLDFEGAHDSHYEFADEKGVRSRLYEPGDENKYLDEILSRYIKQHGGFKLVDTLKPFITAQYHFE